MVKKKDSRQLELLLTEHCSLCDRALDVLLDETNLQGVTLTTLDIVDDDELLQEYGEQIPVLRCGVETLKWPFNAEQVRGWLRQCGV